MRQYLTVALIIASVTAVAADPKPDPKPTPAKATAAKSKTIDAKAVADKLEVFRDDFGGFYVSPKPRAFGDDDNNEWVFYGDNKTLYRQRVIAFSMTQGTNYEWLVWSPRVRGIPAATIELAPGTMHVACKVHDHKALIQLTAAEAKDFFAHATFLPVLWQRESHFLARDDEGVYYFVDELRKEVGGNGYRVFVGQKGSLKELPMTNVVSDTAGEIFATKTGELRIVSDGDGKAYWKRGGKKTDLIVLDLWKNRYLIYRELGIYGQLGVVCDEQ